MSKPYRTGLVVGKFSPLHSGHRYLIDTATAACEQVLLLSYSRPEFAGCTSALRQQWLNDGWPQHQCVVLDAAQACRLGLAMPDNDASDLPQRQFCAELIDRTLGEPVNAVFSSEDYGQGFADYLAAHWQRPVDSVLVDRERQRYPISGSTLRAAPDANWQTADVLAAQRCQRIALIGAESTGKTSLGQWLAQHRGWRWVAEFGRQHWQDCDGVLTSDDLLHIARTQVELEDQAVALALNDGQPAVVCDTTPLTTLIYHRLLFPEPPPDELIALAERPYHQLWLCSADFPMVQDGTRSPETFRQQQQALYASELASRQLRPMRLQGSIKQRRARLAAMTPSDPPRENNKTDRKTPS
ncbi:transcriptional regulator NadR [Halopseudomonas oceani]|uniref:ATPase n=1 Tax=Halopseudomonas oceani TaxID=1708783 RepID=A0A2P4EUI8_9GAMM|nr:AAA family ATPase [Halopseudomonas oceani]POB03136.1 ATPase [Halopseudomonas oceani]GGE49009.1 transcriptional regulator NadR [Halopseudomonas oceani]